MVSCLSISDSVVTLTAIIIVSLSTPHYPDIDRPHTQYQNSIALCTACPGQSESIQTIEEDNESSSSKITYADHGTIRFIFSVDCSEELLQAFENAGISLG